MSQTQPNDPQDTPPPTSTPAGETASAAPVPSLEEQLAAARQEAAAAHERHLRAVADLENFRKRTVREKDELRQFAAANVLEDLIPVLDNLGLGLAAAGQQTDVRSVAQGVAMVIDQLKSTLGRHGLRELNPAGAAFDPHQHDCLAHQPDAAVPAEHVVQVVRLGYALNGRLLRPASVVVSSGAAAPTDENPS